MELAGINTNGSLRYEKVDYNHDPECPGHHGKPCNNIESCPCICHESQRVKYYTKEEIDERFCRLLRFFEHDSFYKDMINQFRNLYGL